MKLRAAAVILAATTAQSDLPAAVNPATEAATTTQTTETLFGNTTPHNQVEADTGSVSLGVQFYSTQAGSIKGVRFFRGVKSTAGYQVGIFDAASGSRLAFKSVTQDTCTVPCWEEIDFDTLLPISSNKTYVAAAYEPGGHYPDDQQGLANKVASGHLVAPANGPTNGGNGVYIYGNKLLRPNQSWNASNYYVDPVFVTAAPPPPTLSLSFDPPNPSIPSNTPPGTIVAKVVLNWSDNVNGSHLFVGTIGFAQPYSNDAGLFAISGTNIVLASTGPGLSGYANTTQNVTITAVPQ
jgi:hypothetical protein